MGFSHVTARTGAKVESLFCVIPFPMIKKTVRISAHSGEGFLVGTIDTIAQFVESQCVRYEEALRKQCGRGYRSHLDVTLLRGVGDVRRYGTGFELSHSFSRSCIF